MSREEGIPTTTDPDPVGTAVQANDNLVHHIDALELKIAGLEAKCNELHSHASRAYQGSVSDCERLMSEVHAIWPGKDPF